MGDNRAPVRIILVVMAFVLFVLGAVAWWATPDNPNRFRLMSAGLACWVLSTFWAN